jgi:hypothetical protein
MAGFPKSVPVQFALLVLLGGLILLAPALLTKAAWVGRKILPVEVRVIDEESGQAIAAATVRVGDGNVDRHKVRWYPGRPVQETEASVAGNATFSVQFRSAGMACLWSRSGSVSFGSTCIEASASGYAPRADYLMTLAGRSGRDLHDASPVQVTLALKRNPTEPPLPPEARNR